MAFVIPCYEMTRKHLSEALLALVFGFALGLSLINYVPFLWGRSLYVQAGFLIISSLLAALIIFWMVFRILLAAQQHNHHVSQMPLLWPAILLGILVRSFLPLPPAPFSPIHPFNMQVKPADFKNPLSHSYDIRLMEMKVDGLRVHPDQVTTLACPSADQKGLLWFEGEKIPGFTYRVDNGLRVETIELIFAETPDAGTAQIVHQNQVKFVDLHQDITTGETAVAIDLPADARREMLWPLADALVLALLFFALSLGITILFNGPHRLPRPCPYVWITLTAAIMVGTLLMLLPLPSSVPDALARIGFIVVAWIANLPAERLRHKRFTAKPERTTIAMQLLFNAALFFLAGFCIKPVSPVLFVLSGVFLYLGAAVLLWQRGTFLRRILYILPFLALSIWFERNDFWDMGALPPVDFYAAYNALRLIFAAYFLHILYGVGHLFISLIEKRSAAGLSWLNRLILSIFSGAAMLRIVFFLFGLTNLYFLSVGLILSLAILFFSAENFFSVLSQGKRRMEEWIAQSAIEDRRIIFLLLTAILLACLALFVVKGTYMVDPVNLSQISPYMNEVVARHGLSPNAYWQGFYATKGASLEILALLLTEKMAPPLVSFVLVLASVSMLFSLVKSFTGNNLWGFVAVLAYIGANLLPGRGDFEGLHTAIGVNILFLFWLCISTSNKQLVNRWVWQFSGIVACFSLAILSWPSAICMLPGIIIYSLLAWHEKNSFNLRLYVIWGLWIVLSVAGIFLLNLLVTGFVDQYGIKYWLPFWNQARTAQWTSNYLWLWFMHGAQYLLPAAGEIYPPLDFLIRLLHLREVWFLLPGLFLALFLFLIDRSGFTRKIGATSYLHTAFIPAILGLGIPVLYGVLGGFTDATLQATEFSLFFVVISLIPLWHACWSYLADKNPAYGGRSYISFLIFFVIAALVSQVVFSLPADLTQFQSRLLFSLGQIDLVQAYENEQPGSNAWPEIRQKIGAQAGVAVFSRSPDCCELGHLLGKGVYTPLSYSYGKDWHILAFGDPAEVKKTYQQLDIDYFYLEDDTVPPDMLAYNALFASQSLEDHFKIVWSRPNQYLLTWRENTDVDGATIPPEFAAEWERLQQGQVGSGAVSYYPRLIHARLAEIYRLNGGKPSGILVPAGLPALEAR